MGFRASKVCRTQVLGFFQGLGGGGGGVVDQMSFHRHEFSLEDEI